MENFYNKKTLYNKYAALNEEGASFSDKIRKALAPLVEEMKDYNMLEIQSIIVDWADYLTSFIRLKEGMELHKKEKENKQQLFFLSPIKEQPITKKNKNIGYE